MIWNCLDEGVGLWAADYLWDRPVHCRTVALRLAGGGVAVYSAGQVEKSGIGVVFMG